MRTSKLLVEFSFCFAVLALTCHSVSVNLFRHWQMDAIEGYRTQGRVEFYQLFALWVILEQIKCTETSFNPLTSYFKYSLRSSHSVIIFNTCSPSMWGGAPDWGGGAMLLKIVYVYWQFKQYQERITDGRESEYQKCLFCHNVSNGKSLVLLY